MAEQQGKLVVLLGIDGSGKTMILQNIAKLGFNVSSWKFLSALSERCPDMDPATLEYLRTLPHGNYVNHLHPLSRSAFVLSLIFAEYEYLIRPLLAAGQTIITDTYYIRPLAKEMAREKSQPSVLSALMQLPDPSLVIHLEIPPEQAFERKNGIVSEHEVDSEKTLTDFVNFQKKVSQACKALTAGMRIIRVNAMKLPELLTAEIKAILEAESWTN